MNLTRFFGYGLSVVGLSALVGCGGGAAMSKGPSAEAYPSTPAQAGYGQPGMNMAPPAPPPEAGASADAAPAKSAHAEPSDRPGLGTEWGETRQSHISSVSFVRADPDQPVGMASLFYNDAEGARAMSSQSGFRKWSGGAFNVANGLVTVGLKDERGQFFNGFIAGEKNYTIGENGSRYTIVLHNNTATRLEIVMSVDGLDVLDGKSASFAKRGYLVDPHGDLEVDGFRQSVDTVAAFRFGSVRDSYANQKHGDTRNVGVIGVAIFHERGTNPFASLNANDSGQRRNANPFPGQFATPP